MVYVYKDLICYLSILFTMKRIFLSLITILVLTSSAAVAQVKKNQQQYSDDPAAREEYDFMRLRDPKTDQIPPFIAQKEFEFASKLPKHDPFGARSNAAASFDWQPMGPMNQAGRTQAIGIDILNEDNMLAGSASGGVWRSIDAGQSWVKVTLPNDEQSVSAIVQDTRKGKESTWYYSTGELLSTTGRRETSNIRTHSWGNGIYKSTDNGTSWDPLLSTITTSSHIAPINFTGIWNLALDTKNSEQDILYAACYGGIMRSSDGGATWTNVLGGDSAKCFNSEIVMGSGGTLYAVIGSVFDGTAPPHQGVWRSVDGINWINISGSGLPKLIRRSRLALSQSNDSILYFLTEAPSDWTAADQEFITLHTLSKYSYKSGAGSGSGGIWENRVVPFDMNIYQYNNSLGGYCLTLAVHPTDPEQVFIGGNSLYYSYNGFQDAGVKLGGYADDPNHPPPYPLHPDMHTLEFSPSDPSRLFVGHDGGISVTDDYQTAPSVWTDFNNGLSSSQVYYSSIDHTTIGSDMIVSGLQDNNSYATLTPDPNAPWDIVDGGDGMTAAVCNGGELFLTSYENAYVDCSTYDGGSITYHGQLPLPPTTASANFFTNYILEPNQTNQLYLAVADELWRYNNLSALISEFDPIPSDWDKIPGVFEALNPSGAFISTFGFATDVRDRLYFGTNTGKVYQVDNAASQSATLKDISGSSFPQNGFVAGIEVDPANADEIIVVFSNYNVQSLFRTIDGGKTWSAIGGNLEELPDGAGSGPSVRCSKIIHTTTGTIYYVGTSVGLYSTTKINGAQTVWTQESPTAIGNLIVENIDARQSDGRVIVSTQGGGVFKNAVTNGVQDQSVSGGQFLQLEQNYPNPFRTYSNIRFTISKRSEVVIELYNALGEKIGIIASGAYEQGSHVIGLSGKNLSAGDYYLRAMADGTVSTKMITIIK